MWDSTVQTSWVLKKLKKHGVESGASPTPALLTLSLSVGVPGLVCPVYCPRLELSASSDSGRWSQVFESRDELDSAEASVLAALAGVVRCDPATCLAVAQLLTFCLRVLDEDPRVELLKLERVEVHAGGRLSVRKGSALLHACDPGC